MYRYVKCVLKASMSILQNSAILLRDASSTHETHCTVEPKSLVSSRPFYMNKRIIIYNVVPVRLTREHSSMLSPEALHASFPRFPARAYSCCGWIAWTIFVLRYCIAWLEWKCVLLIVTRLRKGYRCIIWQDIILMIMCKRADICLYSQQQNHRIKDVSLISYLHSLRLY